MLVSVPYLYIARDVVDNEETVGDVTAHQIVVKIHAGEPMAQTDLGVRLSCNHNHQTCKHAQAARLTFLCFQTGQHFQ